MTTSESFRKRAADLDKKKRGRTTTERSKLIDKQRALIAMAENEDWLDGKPGSQDAKPSSQDEKPPTHDEP